MATSAIRQFKPVKKGDKKIDHFPPPVRNQSQEHQKRPFKDITPVLNNDSKVTIPQLVNRRVDSSVEVPRASIHAQAREDIKNTRQSSN